MKKHYYELRHGQSKVTLNYCEWTIIHWYYADGDVPVCILMNNDDPLNPVFETMIGKDDEQMIVGLVRNMYDK